MSNPIYVIRPNDTPEWGLVIATFLAIVAALVIATQQDRWRDRYRRSRIEYFGTASHMQGQDQLGGNYRLHYLRLILRNSRYAARDVQISVIRIKEDIKDNTVMRGNFLEVPLNWTHGMIYHPSGVVRDIQRNQSAYLDICSGPTNYENLELCTGVGGNADFRVLNPGKTVLTLALFQRSGQTLYMTVRINWEKGARPTLKFINLEKAIATSN